MIKLKVMIVFPNAKINLGLSVTGKRADGFHNLETIFYPVPWTDALEIIPAEKFEFSSTGFDIQTQAEDNLCVKVYRSMKEEFHLPEVKIHLHKAVPSGAGLGGGSSDAASTIKLLNALFNLSLSAEEMEERIKKFGSDCAFFIRNKPVFASGKGDEFTPIELSLKGKFLVIVFPGFQVSTKEAYQRVQAGEPALRVMDIISSPLENWKDRLQNDFEKNVFPAHPRLAGIKEQLYLQGAVYASMSGSGSAVFGIFNEEVDIQSKFHPVCTLWQGFLD